CAECTRRGLGKLTGGDEGDALFCEADRYLHTHGVVAPAPVDAATAPGLAGPWRRRGGRVYRRGSHHVSGRAAGATANDVAAAPAVPENTPVRARLRRRSSRTAPLRSRCPRPPPWPPVGCTRRSRR